MNFGDATTTATTATTTATGTGSWLDKILGAGQKAADIYSTVKGSGTSQSPNVPSTVNINTPAPAPAQDNTMKYVLIGGAILLVGGGIYLATRKKKK